jgi:hypothetical protein
MNGVSIPRNFFFEIKEESEKGDRRKGGRERGGEGREGKMKGRGKGNDAHEG